LNVGPLEHGGDLELARCHLVVPGLGRDTQLEQLTLGIEHEAQDALRYGAEIVVVKFLALGRLRPEQGTPGVQQVGTGQEEAPVDEEVLLLGPGKGNHRVGVLVAEEAQHPLGLRRHRLL
jgi:hypothetical protein